MNCPPFEDDRRPSMWRDLRSGQAGWFPRLVLSVASGFVLAAFAALAFGFPSMRPIGEEYLFLLSGMAGLLWCWALVRIWASFRYARKALKTLFGIMAIWMVTVALYALIVSSIRPPVDQEPLILAFVLIAIAGSIWLPATMIYRYGGGEAILNETGEVNVRCPACGYSMIGLEECRCPECGTQTTIDELIRRQDYAALRGRTRQPDATGGVKGRARLFSDMQIASNEKRAKGIARNDALGLVAQVRLCLGNRPDSRNPISLLARVSFEMSGQTASTPAGPSIRTSLRSAAKAAGLFETIRSAFFLVSLARAFWITWRSSTAKATSR